MSKNKKKKKNATQKDLPVSRDNIITVLDAPDYQPLNLAGMLEALSLPAEAADALANLIAGMVDDGIVVKLKHKGFARATDADLLIGMISFTKTGHAFVAEANSAREVFVPSGAHAHGTARRQSFGPYRPARAAKATRQAGGSRRDPGAAA